MSKIIKVSTDLEVTVHDFPQGTIREQNRQLCELIGNGCEMIEHVMPRRLYNELGHTTEVKTASVWLCWLTKSFCSRINFSLTRLAAICTKPTNTAPQSWETFCL